MLCVAFDASAFQPKSSGEIEVRLLTPLARQLLEQIERHSGAKTAEEGAYDTQLPDDGTKG